MKSHDVEILERLERIENQNKKMDDLQNRLVQMERHLINLNIALQSANHLVELLNKPLSVDDRHLAYILADIKRHANDFREQSEKIDIKQTMGEIKFIGKRLDAIEKDIASMKEQGVKKNIHLDLTLDGYEMVKRKAPKFEDEIDKQEEKQNIEQDNGIERLLKTLADRESKVLVHRFGLLGKKKKTLSQIANLFGLVSGESIRRIEAAALRKSRHKCRKSIVDMITHKELKKAICGE